MQQYTTEWAKELLRYANKISHITQDKDGTVWIYDSARTPSIDKQYSEWSLLSGDCYELGEMLEHPDGWENSLVTREML